MEADQIKGRRRDAAVSPRWNFFIETTEIGPAALRDRGGAARVAEKQLCAKFKFPPSFSFFFPHFRIAL